MSLKKTITCNGKQIIVYDNLFNRRENLDIYNLIVNASFVRSNIDCSLLNNKDKDVKWKSGIQPGSPLSNIITQKYSSVISEVDWTKLSILEQYINYATSNTVDVIHADVSSESAGSYTILHYANHTWDVNWHGETIFYDDNCTEIVYASIIKPGSVVIFDSRLQHSATAPSALADHPRYTIATKIITKN